MKDQMHIKPCESFKIRDPHTKLYLPEKGATVPRISFWLRRLAAGEVEEIKEVGAVPKKSKGSTK